MSSVLAIALVALVVPVYGQVTTPCNPSVLPSFTPCMNFLTNSTSNGGSPITDCCGSLKNLTSSGLDCLCLIVAGSVPFQIPINRTLAISLPRVCNMAGVPVQCKASASPIPAPAPTAPGPALPPGSSPSATPQGPVVPEPTPSTPPPSTTPVRTPPTGDSGVPTSTPGSRPFLTPPSAAMPSYSFSPSILILALGVVIFKCY